MAAGGPPPHVLLIITVNKEKYFFSKWNTLNTGAKSEIISKAYVKSEKINNTGVISELFLTLI